jgi:hypothetical protein
MPNVSPLSCIIILSSHVRLNKLIIILANLYSLLFFCVFPGKIQLDQAKCTLRTDRSSHGPQVRTMDVPARYDSIMNRGRPYLNNHNRWSDAFGVVTFFMPVLFQ